MTRVSGLLVSVLATAVLAGSASAQTIGTFSWQTHPYCNVVSMTVVQVGAVFQVLGSDDQCGAGAIPLDGTAIFNGSSVAFGVSVATASGRAAHISATISLATLSGTWADADGNSGSFVFAPASPSGSPRPAPTGSTSITVAQLSPTVYAGTGAAATVSRSDHTHDDRYFTETESTATFVPRANVLTAHINGAGGLVRGIGAVSSQRVLVPNGEYEVVFNRNITTCVLSASALGAAFNRSVSIDYRLGNVNAVFLISENTSTNSVVDNGVFVTVICP